MKGIKVTYKTVNDLAYIRDIKENEKILMTLFLSDGLFDLIVGNNPGVSHIEFGEYPIEKVNIETQNELNKAKRTLNFPIETGRSFMMEHSFISHKEIVYDTIWTKNKEATSYHVSQVKKRYFEYKYNNKKYIFVDVGSEKGWFEIKPIVWSVDYQNKSITPINLTIDALLKEEDIKVDTRIIDNIFLPDLSYKDLIVQMLIVNKEKTQKHLEKTVLNDILQTAHLEKTITYKNYEDLLKIIAKNNNFEDFVGVVEITLEGPKLKDSEKENVNKLLNNKVIYKEIEQKKNPNEEINSIVNNINELLNLGVSDNPEKIKSKIDKLIEEYNKNIKEYNNLLVMERNDIHYLFNKLTSDLEDILNNLMHSNNINEEYIKMLKLINNCTGIIKKDEDVVAVDDFEKDIQTIVNNILPSLVNSDKKEELINILNNEKERILSYIKGNDNSPAKNYKSLKEFKIVCRRKLQSFLVKTKKELQNNSVVREVQKEYDKIMSGLTFQSEDEYINFLLKELQKNIKRIQKEGTEEDNKILSNILETNKIEENKNFLKNVSLLNESIKETYSIIRKIEEREKEQREIDNYTISIK